MVCKCETLNISDSCTNDLYILTNDGSCHDESNTQACAWDGGDCCKSDAILAHCHFCYCHEEDAILGLVYDRALILDLTRSGS